MSDLFDNLKQQLNITETELLKALTQALSTQTTKSSSDEGSTPSPTPSEPITSNDEDDGDDNESPLIHLTGLSTKAWLWQYRKKA